MRASFRPSTARGKAAYNIPMYVNTWLMSDDAPPGDYPSGCPEPRVMDMWKAAGTAIDFYAPDLYAPTLPSGAERYHRDGNPLFMPEARGGASARPTSFMRWARRPASAFRLSALKTRPRARATWPQAMPCCSLDRPLLAERQSAGAVHGFVLEQDHSMVEFVMNGYTVHVTLDEIFGDHARDGFGLMMATGPDEFMGVGKGFRVNFTPRSPAGPEVGIAAVDEGSFADGKWVPGRRLNGDENDQGNAWRFDSPQVRTEKVKLYRFE